MATPSKQKIRSLEKELKKAQAQLAKDRDHLDALIGEYVSLKEHCNEAFDLLQDARDSLSRLI